MRKILGQEIRVESVWFLNSRCEASGGWGPLWGGGNLEEKYPESLAEKKEEGVFCSITEEGQEVSLPKQQGRQESIQSNHHLHLSGLASLIMDNQAYDHDMSVMNNNNARKKELEV